MSLTLMGSPTIPTSMPESSKRLKTKKEEVANIESRIYGNVLALFAVFAAIFTLVNVNAGGSLPIFRPSVSVALDLLIIGGFLVLASAIEAFLIKDKRRRHDFRSG